MPMPHHGHPGHPGHPGMPPPAASLVDVACRRVLPQSPQPCFGLLCGLRQGAFGGPPPARGPEPVSMGVLKPRIEVILERELIEWFVGNGTNQPGKGMTEGSGHCPIEKAACGSTWKGAKVVVHFNSTRYRISTTKLTSFQVQLITQTISQTVCPHEASGKG